MITRCGRCRFDDSAGPRSGCGTRVGRALCVCRALGAGRRLVRCAHLRAGDRDGPAFFFGLGGAMRAHFARTRCGRRIQFNTVLPSAAMARSTIATRWIVSSIRNTRACSMMDRSTGRTWRTAQGVGA